MSSSKMLLEGKVPKTNRFDKYFDKETTKTTPKVQINSATFMGQTAKDCGYMEACRTFRQYRTGDVPTPSPLQKQYEPNDYYTDVNSTNTHFVDTCTI